MTLITVDSSIFGFLWFLIITEIALAIPFAFLVIAWVKAGKHGRAYFWAWAKHKQIVEEFGTDGKVRLRLTKGDGITLRDEKIRKTWRPTPDSRFTTVDGVSVFPSYAPSYTTLAPKVLASIQQLDPSDRDALSDAIDEVSRRQKVTMKPIDVPIVGADGKTVVKKERMYVAETPVGKEADPGNRLSETPVDGKDGIMLSPRQIYDWLLTSASPYDLNLVLNNGIALGQDMERKRQSTEMTKYIGLAILFISVMAGIYIVLKALHVA